VDNKMNNEEWIKENTDIGKHSGWIWIDCGHNYKNYTVPLRDYEPSVYLTLCTACYQRMMGFFLNEITTIKFDKVRF